VTAHGRPLQRNLPGWRSQFKGTFLNSSEGDTIIKFQQTASLALVVLDLTGSDPSVITIPLQWPLNYRIIVEIVGVGQSCAPRFSAALSMAPPPAFTVTPRRIRGLNCFN